MPKYGFYRELAFRRFPKVIKYLNKYNMPMYGFFSETAFNNAHGYYKYLNNEGKEVFVTHVTNDINGEGYNWKDKVFVGELKTYL